MRRDWGWAGVGRGGGGLRLWKCSSASALRDSAMSAVPTWKRPSRDSLLRAMALSPAVSASSCSSRRVETSLRSTQPRSSSGATVVKVCSRPSADKTQQELILILDRGYLYAYPRGDKIAASSLHQAFIENLFWIHRAGFLRVTDVPRFFLNSAPRNLARGPRFPWLISSSSS
jgi:hypothetical protein